MKLRFKTAIAMQGDLSRFENRVDLQLVRDRAGQIRDALGRMLVGQERRVDLLLAALLAGGHVLIEGVPGVAKTLTAKLLARAVSVGFSRIQFTPDLMPADIVGTSVFNPQTTIFEFKPGPIFSNLILIDEVNRAPAKTQSALFEVMEERQVTVDGQTYRLPPPFMVIATQNPLEHEGTYRLPEAQLDRFLFRVEVGYPSLEEETQILEKHQAGHTPENLDLVGPVISGEELGACREAVGRVHAEPNLLRYIATIVHTTRSHSALSLGGSPRASLGILTAAKALAALAGRDFVIPDDVQEVASPVLNHRIQLTPEQEMEGRRPADVVRDVIQRVEVPR